MLDTRPATAPVEVRPKTPQEVGEHAARYIEEHGWTQGSYHDRHGAVCVQGAIAAVTGDGNHSGAGYDYNEATRGLSATLGTFRTIQWNDAPERTLAEVLAALRSIR